MKSVSTALTNKGSFKYCVKFGGGGASKTDCDRRIYQNLKYKFPASISLTKKKSLFFSGIYLKPIIKSFS